MKSLFWRTTTTLGSTDEKICASHTNVFLFLLNRTWNFSSQSFVKWTDEQVSFLISVLVVSFNMLYICHIFFALLSCLHQYMKTFMIQFPALELSLAGLNFHSQVFVSHRYRVLHVHLKFCTTSTIIFKVNRLKTDKKTYLQKKLWLIKNSIETQTFV